MSSSKFPKFVLSAFMALTSPELSPKVFKLYSIFHFGPLVNYTIDIVYKFWLPFQTVSKQKHLSENAKN